MTSVSAAFYRAIPNLEARQEKVLDVIRRCPQASSNDVARISKMEVHNVRCRITELLSDGRIVATGTKTDRITGYRVRTYCAPGDEEAMS